jgi:Malectin domain
LNNTNGNNTDYKDDGNKTNTTVPPADGENSTKTLEPLDYGNNGTNNNSTNNRSSDDTLLPAPTSAPIMRTTVSPTMETGSAAKPTIPPTDNSLPDLSAIYINAGGASEPVTTDDGTEWVSDAKYVTSDGMGTTSASDQCMSAIQNSSFQILGCTERNFDVRGTYEIPVNDTTKRPTKKFRFVLYFVETVFGAVGDRLFEILIEDQVPYGNYDIYEEAGGQFIVVQLSDEVTVEDGSVTIVFESFEDKAKINAIEIQPIYESSE